MIYIKAGVSKERIFRTALNDAEAVSDKDWEDDSLTFSCIDKRGDDDIEIIITANDLKVQYRNDGIESLCR